MKNNVDLSIVIPVYNEADVLLLLIQKTREALLFYGKVFEIIVIDDGSSDGSREILEAQCQVLPELKAIIFRRNFGQSAAMTAGFDYANGDVVVSMDGDLQNDPADIPLLVDKLEEGYDVVSGWRKNRKDHLISRKLPSKIANKIIGWTTGVILNDYGCSLKAYRKEVAKQLLLYGELHRFIPVLANLYGSKTAEVHVNHNARETGKSKYGINRTYRVIIDLMLMLFFQKFATRPLQLFGFSGGLLFISGFIMELYLTWIKLFNGQDIGNRPLLILGVLLVVTGVILLGIGLLAELIIRIYYESSDKHIYSVREIFE